MFNKNIKLVLAAATIGYAIYQFIENNIDPYLFCFKASISKRKLKGAMITQSDLAPLRKIMQ